jgi:thiamine-phosphate pyrophosphorylase
MVGRVHLITDPRPGADDLNAVRAALDAGVDTVQIRVKQAGDALVLRLVEQTLELLAPYGAACVVDDRLDVALAAGATGVHLGADDLPVAAARSLAGDRLLVGATVRDPEAARRAADEGADYLGVGPVRPTTTKAGLPAPIGVAGVAAVCAATPLPVVAIGGVTVDLVPDLLAAGAHGVAVVGAVHRAVDPGRAAAALVDALGGSRR